MGHRVKKRDCASKSWPVGRSVILITSFCVPHRHINVSVSVAALSAKLPVYFYLFIVYMCIICYLVTLSRQVEADFWCMYYYMYVYIKYIYYKYAF